MKGKKFLYPLFYNTFFMYNIYTIYIEIIVL